MASVRHSPGTDEGPAPHGLIHAITTQRSGRSGDGTAQAGTTDGEVSRTTTSADMKPSSNDAPQRGA